MVENISASDCYSISADFQAAGICDLFRENCDSVHLLTQLNKSNESDPVVITVDRAIVTVEIPDQCRCSSPSSDKNNIIITATTSSVLSVVVAIGIATVIIVMVLLHYRRKAVFVTNKE